MYFKCSSVSRGAQVLYANEASAERQCVVLPEVKGRKAWNVPQSMGITHDRGILYSLVKTNNFYFVFTR